MLSIVVLGIGAAGVMSMQRASVQGNNDARMMDTGNSIAREWIERLRRDAMTWTMPDEATGGTVTAELGRRTRSSSRRSAPTPTPERGSGPRRRREARTPGTPTRGTGEASTSSGATSRLRERRSRALMYCANVRGDWLIQDQLLRAEVRVYWLRQMFAAPTAVFCSGLENPAPDATGTGGGTQVYHFIYATTAISRNSPQ